MSLSRTQSLGIFGVLLVVMGFVYTRALWRPAPLPAAPSETSATEPVGAPRPAALETPAILPLSAETVAARDTQRRRATALAWGRDPFLAGDSSGEASGLELSGILWDPAQPMAIINGHTVHPGEECDGYRVVTITQDTVTLTDGAETFHLTTIR